MDQWEEQREFVKEPTVFLKYTKIETNKPLNSLISTILHLHNKHIYPPNSDDHN